jgi:ElaB/YqjD/DUF883 family membrane-anchored ribosome-binding protein
MEESWRRWSDASQDDPDNEFTDASPVVSIRRIRDTDLEIIAARAGNVAGRVVAVLRRVRRMLAEPERHDLAESAMDRAEEWRRAAREKAENLRWQARGRFQQARQRAEQIGRDYPLQTLLAMAAAGFLIGAAVRRRGAHHAG